eukprot:TRINITY_DN7346_c0_g1_i9.p1 TRINITY_DN7346_c0_g1~~TRINITY_DN7346_c0_g1_i9.p1  ORF type:complete len:954 (+),score=292.40 TRINITY_DN7346_c0_g1_i9:233-3094(+)
MAMASPPRGRWMLVLVVAIAVTHGTEQHPESDQTSHEPDPVSQQLAKVPPFESFLPAALRPDAELLNPAVDVAGTKLSVRMLQDDRRDLSDPMQRDYYSEYSYHRRDPDAERLVALQTGEAGYPWVISQKEAQRRSARLSKQHRRDKIDKAKLESHSVPLKDTMHGRGVRERVEREVAEWDKTHPNARSSRSRSSDENRAEETTMRRLRELGDDDEDEDEGPVFGERQRAGSGSAWGDDDDSEDDPGPPLGYGRLELLQLSSPDMMSILAGKIHRHRQRQAHIDSAKAHAGLAEGRDAQIQKELKVQSQFTSQLNQQVAHASEKASSAGQGSLRSVIVDRQQPPDSNGFKFVPKSQADLAQSQRVAKEVDRQKELAASFQRALASRTRKAELAKSDAVTKSRLDAPRNVRGLFDRTTGTSTRIGNKLQPQLKHDSSWRDDAAHEQQLSEQASAYLTRHGSTQDSNSGGMSVKKLLGGSSEMSSSVDETGMRNEPGLRSSGDRVADKAKKVAQQMLQASLASQRRMNKHGERADAEGDTVARFRAYIKDKKNGAPASSEESTEPEEQSRLEVPGQQVALKLAAQFVQKSAGRSGADLVDAATPSSRAEMAAMLTTSSRHQRAEVHTKPPSSRLTKQDQSQVEMQREMVQQTEAANRASDKRTVSQDPELRIAEKNNDIAKLFTTTPPTETTKPVPRRQAVASKQDRRAVQMQQEFVSQLQSRSAAVDKSAAASLAKVERSRAGVTELFQASAHAHARGKPAMRTHLEDSSTRKEFAKQKQLQMTVLKHMLRQQKAQQEAAEAATPSGKLRQKDMRDMFRVSHKSKMGQDAARRKYDSEMERDKSWGRQRDRSGDLEDHAVEMRSVIAPEAKTRVPDDPKSALLLEQESSGELEKQQAEALKRRVQKEMKRHFLEMLEQNKKNFRRLTHEHGTKGATTFYQNMKQSLQSLSLIHI